MSKRTVAVDFDGTISKYYKWTGPYNMGAPLEGAREFLEALRERGYFILIYSCRPSTETAHKKMEQYMQEHDLPYDRIFTEGCKPEATAYFDDRAISVQPQKNGRDDFDRALNELDKLVAWKKKEKTD